MKTLKESILSRSSHGAKGFEVQRRTEMIKEWLRKYNIENYTINKDFTIDVDGNVILVLKNLSKFPEYIQFGVVRGNFDCSNNNLISLRGCPRKVEGFFNCNYNHLKSLENCPVEVGSSVYCFRNNLKSLVGAPKKVGGSFYCSNNQLKSLEGAPEKVEGDFDCSHNKLTSLEGAPKEVERFDCGGNSVRLTREDVRKVCRVKIW